MKERFFRISPGRREGLILNECAEEIRKKAADWRRTGGGFAEFPVQ